MATNYDRVFRPTDEASVALLRGLRAKTVDRSFIHRADVCSVVPEELVAGLQPVPGTEVTDDGYKSVWYIYCPKRYKNARGEPSGHRQRSVEPDGGDTCWHSETGPKPVQGVPGATFCNLSYCRKEVSGRRFKYIRLGWWMTEFDDTQDGGGDHVLCRVHRSSSSLAKKSKSSSSSSSSSCKRKAAGDHPEAPPTKLFHDEQVQPAKLIHDEQVQQNAAAFYTDAYPTMPYYGYGPPQSVDPVTMVGGEDDHKVQQPRLELEAEHFDGSELNDVEEFTNTYPAMPCYDHGVPQGMDPVTTIFGGEEEHGVQQPRVESEYGGDFNYDELLNINININDEQMVPEQLRQDPAAFTDAYSTMPCYGYGPPQGVDPVTMVGDVEPEHGGDQLGELNLFQDLFKTDEWTGFEEFLAERDQQGGGIIVSGDLLYAC